MDEVVQYYGPYWGTFTLGYIVESISIINAGCGFTANPTVVFSGGNPFNHATATTTNAFAIRLGTLTPGTGYTSVPTVSFTGGTAINNNHATATCTISGGGVNTCFFTNCGLYSVRPTGVVFTGGGGNNDAAIIVASGLGTSIATFKINSKGKYYSGTPTISISGGGGSGAALRPVMTYYGLGKTYDNTTIYNNLKKFRFSLNNNFHNILLGDNAKVTVESIYLPSIINEIQNTQKLVRICGVSDSVFDTERGLNNSPIIYSITTDDILFENAGVKNSKSFRIPKDFLSKNYIEFEVSVDLPSGATSDIMFGDNNFMASIIIYEEELEQTDDINLAPTVNKSNYHKY